MVKKQYKNNKNGNIYQILHMATDRTNAREGTEVIVYSPISNLEEISVRDADEFFVKFSPYPQDQENT